MDGLMRHIRQIGNIRLPGPYTPLRLGENPVGFASPETAARLRRLGWRSENGVIVAEDPAALRSAASALAEDGVFRPRGEEFDVRARPGGPVLATLDRGALPVFGIVAEGVHVNGLASNGTRLWIGKRAADRALDPDKLDQLCAGGIAAGMDAAATLEKEGWEEARIPRDLARTARHVGTLAYAMTRPEGLRRDRLHCFDLDLPEDFTPISGDGEVHSFTPMKVTDVLARVRDTDDFKFNVNLVLIDLFLRRGLSEDPALRQGLDDLASGILW